MRKLSTGKRERYRVGRRLATELRNRESRSWRRKNEQIRQEKTSRVDKDDTSSDSQSISSFRFRCLRLDCFPETLAGVGFGGGLHPEVSYEAPILAGGGGLRRGKDQLMPGDHVHGDKM